jgi:hypothetical protein
MHPRREEDNRLEEYEGPWLAFRIQYRIIYVLLDLIGGL